jgi:hypothetical protein
MSAGNPVVEWINAISVLVLVGVTGYYAWTTKKILSESEKMRKAAEKQAVSAASQASAASATLHHLREQLEDFQGLGISIVRTNIDSLIRGIDQWKKLDIKSNFAVAASFPPPAGLIPANISSVLEHARKISEGCVDVLTSAIDDLRAAQNQIEILIRGATLRHTAYFDPAGYDPGPFLTSAFSKLQEARKLIS